MNEQTVIPLETLPDRSDYERVARAITFIETHFQSQPTLEDIAEHVSLSKFHFQRLFKRWAGVSPTQFRQYLTVEYAKQRLIESESVLATALDAGLSGPGRLHDLLVTFTAASPGELKRRGGGLTIRYGFHPTPFGTCLIAVTERGICALRFVGESAPAALRLVRDEWPGAVWSEDSAVTAPLIARLFAPAGASPTKPFHLLVKGTNFQIQVWRALTEIPTGFLLSYENVAHLIGRPTATRAVASAIARNPIAYLVPCHRVISKSGATNNYRWGSVRKRAILGWEASQR